MLTPPDQAPTPTTPGASMLDGTITTTAVIVVAAGFLLIGLVVAIGRSILGAKEKDPVASFVRSWLGLGLIAGLLVSCAASLGISDPTLRSTLFGGLIASAGAASAFYFASAGSDQARQDILTASRPAVLVPELTGKTLTEAKALFGNLPMTLVSDPLDAAPSTLITKTEPAAGSVARVGETVTAHTT